MKMKIATGRSSQIVQDTESHILVEAKDVAGFHILVDSGQNRDAVSTRGERYLIDLRQLSAR